MYNKTLTVFMFVIHINFEDFNVILIMTQYFSVFLIVTHNTKCSLNCSKIIKSNIIVLK